MHWLKTINRDEPLEVLFDGFTNALTLYRKKTEEMNWYDADWFMEETDLIYGVILLSLQNYINQYCSDFLEAEVFGFKNKYEYYNKNSRIIKGSNVSQIQLIIDLANHFKHRDDPFYIDRNNDRTRMISHFKELGIEYPLKISDSENPRENIIENPSKRVCERFEFEFILNGIKLICPDILNLNELPIIVKKWKDEIWAESNK